MALTTYAELQTAMTSWLGNSINAASYPDMITLFEAWVNRKTRVRQQETTTNLTTTLGVATLPTDYVAWRRATWVGNPRVDLDYVQPSYFQDAFPTRPAGFPDMFAIEGSSLIVLPYDDSSQVEFLYYAKVPALSGTVNWLFTAHPDIYLFGSLCEAELFGVNDERAALWKARRDEILTEIQMLDNKSKGIGFVRINAATP